MGNASAFFSLAALLLPMVSAGPVLVDPHRFVRHPVVTVAGSPAEAPALNPEIVRVGAHEKPALRPGTMVTDPFITAQVKTLLLRRSILKDLDIQVDTKDGVVRLSGVVQNEDQVVQALEAASEAEGVKAVINALVVKS